MNTRRAFTLAEVLITLGIIGVVAALTMPSIIEKHQKRVTAAQLKKSYSLLNQALQRSIAENGDVSTWDYENIYASNIGEKYFLPYMHVVGKKFKYEARNSSDTYRFDYTNNNYAYPLADGTVISFANFFPGNGYDWSMNYALYLIIDVNGKKGPNRAGRDVFSFTLPTERSNAKNRKLNTIQPDYYYVDNVKTAAHSCTPKGVSTYAYTGRGCTLWIMQDGWEIKDDYPWW